MSNIYLEKIASDTQKKNKRTIGSAANELLGAGIGAAGLSVVPSHLLGYESVYHGTSKEGANNILKEGLRKSYGGTRGSVITTHGQGQTDAFVNEAKKHVYVTQNKEVAKHFAGDSAKYINMYGANDPRALSESIKAYKSGVGRVLSARIPYQTWDRKFEMDPDSFNKFEAALHGESRLKPIAARSKRDIPAKYFSGGEGNRGVVEFMNKRHLKNYLSTQSGRNRAMVGGAWLALGSGLIGGAAYSNAKSGGILSKLKREKHD